ncbi:MAG: DNA damage-inducible protein D [Ignavibacteria bacterium]|nr:DNA damage-inducible protein D [Ignavibacteria bacterium]
MKKEQIAELFEKFEAASAQIDEFQYWSSRALSELFGYADWRNFMNVVEKAKTACNNSGEKAENHFVDITKMVKIGSGSEREVVDIALTRYACYLVAQNGNPAKAEVAFAQTYFAVQTRKQEIIEQRMLDIARISAREKLSRSENKLSGIIYERGVDEMGFAIIRSKGDQALFGGFTTQDMKRKLKIPASRPLADFLPTLIIKAKDFATELTSHNVTEKDLKGQEAISKEHIDNNKAVRKILHERGVEPEALPPDEDVKKIKSKLERDDKNVLKEAKSLKRKKKE